MTQRFVTFACVFFLSGLAFAQPASRAAQAAPPTNGSSTPGTPASSLPAGYVIGAEDVLSVVFWREREMSADVVVRPDGKISVPLLDDVQAAGYTPEQLSRLLEKSAAKFVAEPNATVLVKEIRSRKVFVIGQVNRPGTFPLASEMNVLQVLAMAGGLLDYADREHIVVIRTENGREQRMHFNYKEVVAGRNVQQNVALRSGDLVVVR